MSDGFAVIPVWLLRDDSVDPKAKTLYLLLSSRVGREGVCWPSQSLLADELGADERTVRRHLATLREMNLVGVTVVRTPTGRRNQYHLLTDRFGGAGVRTPAPAPSEGGEDTSVLMGEDTSVLRTRDTRTTPVAHTPAEVAGNRPEPYALTKRPEPETHPSRAIPPNFQPRPVYAQMMMRQYPGIDLRESCARFVAFHIGRGDTSRSWEAALLAWVSQDWERWKDRQGGTDDLGVPKGQRAGKQRAAQPGDPDYVDPEEIHAAARRLASPESD